LAAIRRQRRERDKRYDARTEKEQQKWLIVTKITRFLQIWVVTLLKVTSKNRPQKNVKVKVHTDFGLQPYQCPENWFDPVSLL